MNITNNKNIDTVLFNLYKENIIASATDLKGIITQISPAYAKISGYTEEELIGKPHNIARHPDMPKSAFQDLWNTIQAGKVWKGEVKNLTKDGSFYWVKATISPYYDNNNKPMGYISVRENITDAKKVEELNKKISTIFDVIQDGYLLFDKEFKIQESYSNKCLEILPQVDNILYNKKIDNILYPSSSQEKEEFILTIQHIFATDDKNVIELYISLLETKLHIKDKDISLQFYKLDNNFILLLLNDITHQITLENKIIYEHKIQKMIVTVAVNKNEIIELKKSFTVFIETLEQKAKDTSIESLKIYLKKELHTYKGLFSQMQMAYITDAIHSIEDNIKTLDESNAYLLLIFLQSNLSMALNRDIKAITEILGEDFVSNTTLLVSCSKLKNLEKQSKILMKKLSHNNKIKFKHLYHLIKALNNKTFYKSLEFYNKTLEDTANRIDKKINPLIINGNKNLYLSKKYKPFVSSLIHIFKNAIIHGIEDPLQRESIGKPEYGTVEVDFKIKNEKLLLSIKDDGKGLNIQEIIVKAKEKNLILADVEFLSINEIKNLIFDKNFSSTTEITNDAGRGVGLFTVADEVKKLKGTIDIKNNPNRSLTFLFTLPYKIKKRKSEKKKILFNKFLNSIKNTTNTFLSEQLILSNITATTQKVIFTERNSITISFIGKKNCFLVHLSIEDKLLLRAADILMAGILDQLNDNEKKDLFNALPAELINTICGLAISSFPVKLKNLHMKEPVYIDNNALEKIKKDAISKNITFKTNLGNVYINIINFKKK